MIAALAQGGVGEDTGESCRKEVLWLRKPERVCSDRRPHWYRYCIHVDRKSAASVALTVCRYGPGARTLTDKEGSRGRPLGRATSALSVGRASHEAPRLDGGDQTFRGASGDPSERCI
jgi:hypothetical protein